MRYIYSQEEHAMKYEVVNLRTTMLCGRFESFARAMDKLHQLEKVNPIGAYIVRTIRARVSA